MELKHEECPVQNFWILIHSSLLVEFTEFQNVEMGVQMHMCNPSCLRD
jgi:hypothetical protein